MSEAIVVEGFWNRFLKFWPVIIGVCMILWAVVQVHFLSEGRLEALTSSDVYQVEKLQDIQVGIGTQFEQLDNRIDERFSHLEQRMDEKFFHVDKTIQFLDRRLEDLREDVRALAKK